MNKDIYKKKLEEEKSIIEEELGSIGKVDEDGDWEASPNNETNTQEVQDEADISERAEDFEERASKVDVLESRLEDINKALDKIETNNYGICESCGKEIEEDRLEANPAAKTCKTCM